MKVSALFYIYYMFNLKMYSIHLNSIHNSKSKKKKKNCTPIPHTTPTKSMDDKSITGERVRLYESQNMSVI